MYCGGGGGIKGKTGGRRDKPVSPQQSCCSKNPAAPRPTSSAERGCPDRGGLDDGTVGGGGGGAARARMGGGAREPSRRRCLRRLCVCVCVCGRRGG
ncbi:hypothetical protein T439DRAFT_156239 [Meredithblackwellia eburnea MCA 4105]